MLLRRQSERLAAPLIQSWCASRWIRITGTSNIMMPRLMAFKAVAAAAPPLLLSRRTQSSSKRTQCSIPLHSLIVSFVTVLSPHCSFHYRSRGLISPNALKPSDLDQEEYSLSSDSDERKSRNEKKREARRAVRWSRVASVEREVFDALTFVKRLGADVREGNRRQYNLIGKLLRDAEPELMDALILATKDGDWSRLEGLSVSVSGIIENANAEEYEETEDEGDEEAY